MKNVFFTLCLSFLLFQLSAQTPCSGGSAAGFPCSNIDLAAHLPLSSLGNPSIGNDIWGWTHGASGREFAIIGLSDGTGFIEVTDPNNPVILGYLATHTSSSSWRDIKTYRDHAFIVSEASNHGMQVFDLTQLLSISSPTTFSNTAHYNGVTSAHNIVINESTGFAYIVGSNGGSQSGCSGGLHMVDISNPTSPVFAGCFSSDGYTHDAQCVTYNGPDAAYVGREICFCYNTDTQTIVDVTNKSSPIEISRTTYSGRGYTHQGWLDESQRYVLINDEYDEASFNHNTRTYVMDNLDLDAPVYKGYHEATTGSIDHNLYTKGNYVYQANYTAGLRILELTDLANANLTEVGYFDIYPPNDNTGSTGAWSVYPYFPSGTIIVSGIGQGLFVLDASAAIAPPTGCANAVVIEVNTDNKASEISWTITNTSTSAVVASGGGLSNNTNNSSNVCLANGCYVFEITDAGGDGICCTTSSLGSYNVSIGGVKIRENGSYGSGESFTFCVNSANQSLCPVDLSDSGTVTKDYQVSNQITSDGTVPVGENVIYDANMILLLPNFEVSNSAAFEAKINPCSN